MCCYQEFGWNPDDIKALSDTESLLLSTYFEELSAYHAEQRIEQEKQLRESRTHQASDGWTDDFVMDGDQEDDE